MFDYLMNELDGKEFGSIEEYNAEVLRIVRDAEEELGRAERWALTNDAEVYEQLGVTIKGVYPEEDDV